MMQSKRSKAHKMSDNSDIVKAPLKLGNITPNVCRAINEQTGGYNRYIVI